jgi:hypothetical protein
MNKHCKYCGKNIKGKAKSYDYYYFCNNIDCLDKYLNEPEIKPRGNEVESDITL